MNMQIFPVNAASGADIFPTTAGTYFTDDMTGGFTEGKVFLEFFADAAGAVPATATAGTVVIEGSPMGNVFLKPSNGASINAADISSGVYVPAKLNGLMVKGSVTLAGIVGAAYCKAVFVRS